MEIYKTIRKTRKILDGLHGIQTHAENRRTLGVSQTVYNELRYYDAVVVADRITKDLYTKLQAFNAIHDVNKDDLIEEEIEYKKIEPKEPHKVFVNNDVENPKQLQLKGKSYDLVKAMADLRKAMEPFFDMGYHIGVTLYKK